MCQVDKLARQCECEHTHQLDWVQGCSHSGVMMAERVLTTKMDVNGSQSWARCRLVEVICLYKARGCTDVQQVALRLSSTEHFEVGDSDGAGDCEHANRWCVWVVIHTTASHSDVCSLPEVFSISSF